MFSVNVLFEHMAPHQQITEYWWRWASPKADPRGAGYNVNQST